MGRKQRDRRQWRFWSRADEDTCSAILYDNLPYGITITIEHNMRLCPGATAVNRLARKMLKWLKEQEAAAAK